jgi:hypothetical protein
MSDARPPPTDDPDGAVTPSGLASGGQTPMTDDGYGAAQHPGAAPVETSAVINPDQVLEVANKKAIKIAGTTSVTSSLGGSRAPRSERSEPSDQMLSPAGVPREEAPGRPTVRRGRSLETARPTATDAAPSAAESAHVKPSATVPPTRPRSESVNDQPNRADAIGFRPYVEALAQFVMNDRTKAPLTVSLEGEWGSGKSSFMDQLEDAINALSAARVAAAKASKNRRRTILARRSRPCVVRFNAWRQDKDEAVWASFALEFARRTAPAGFRGLPRRLWLATALSVRRFDWAEATPLLLRLVAVCVIGVLLFAVLIRFLLFPSLNKTEAHVTDFAEWWSYLKHWAPVAIATPGAALLVSALRRIMSRPLELDLKKLIAVPGYKEKISFLERFQEDFALFVKTYLADRRTIVLVDDLDRCEAAKAAEILQALNLMLAHDSPLFLIIALDRKKIAMGIATRNKDLLPFVDSAEDPRSTALPAAAPEAARGNQRAGIAYGYEFIEKFIQLPFRIPKLTSVALPGFLGSLLGPPTRPALGGSGAPHDEPDVADRDEAHVQFVLSMVAPALGYNPRRMKQFLNLFRLRHFVAANTGQLQDASPRGWTLHQLGIIVAIELRWPLLLDQLLRDPGDLIRLRDGRAPHLSRWSSDEALGDLVKLKGGATSEDYVLTNEVAGLLPTLYGTSPVVGGSGKRRRRDEGVTPSPA